MRPALIFVGTFFSQKTPPGIDYLNISDFFVWALKTSGDVNGRSHLLKTNLDDEGLSQ